MKLMIHDIECGINFFCTTILNLKNDKLFTYEISTRRNDLQIMCKHYNYLSKIKVGLIGFNSIGYDDPVINYIRWNYTRLSKLPIFELLADIKQYSNLVIDTEQWWQVKKVKKYYKKHNWHQIDLQKFWSKQLRQSKRISLKSLGIQLNYPVVQELPFKHDEWIPEEKFDEIIHYNRVHDITITKWVFEKPIYWQGKPTTFRKQLELRIDIKKRFGINCLYYDAPKIASEIMKSVYSKKTGLSYKEIEEKIFNFPSLQLEPIEFKLPEYKKLYNRMFKLDRDIEETVYLNHKNTSLKISYGIGGIKHVSSL